MKTAIIFGCNKGHGAYLRERWADREDIGAVWGVNRTPSSEYLHPKYKEIIISESDLSSGEVLKKAIHSSIKKVNLVHIAIGTILLKPFLYLSEEDWSSIMDVNFMIPMRCIYSVLPLLEKETTSSITAMTTVASTLGMPFHTSVAASKSALEGLMKSLAAEHAPVRFNMISSSIFESPCAQKNTALFHSEEQALKSKARHVLNNFGTMEQIAAICDFISKPEASFMTGITICNDGGLSHTLPF